MIDGFITGVFYMVGILLFLSALSAYCALISFQVRRKSPTLAITAGLPALLIVAGFLGVVLS